MMKKTYFGSSLLIAVIFITSIFLTAQAIAQTNVLQNYSFEDNTGWWSSPDWWAIEGNASWKGAIQGTTHQGDWALGIGNDRGPRGANGYTFQDICSNFNSGDVVSFNMWVKSEVNYSGNASLILEFLDVNNNVITFFQSSIYSGTFDWVLAGVNGAVPAETAKVRVYCLSENMSRGSRSSLVIFDDGNVAIEHSILSREVINLNGTWEIEPSDTQPTNFNHTISVPGLVDLAVPSIDWNSCNYFWYKKTFTLIPSQARNHAFIKIDQSKYGTEVWLNGTYLGSYIGCYTSHKYDVTDIINYNGENVLLVKIGQKGNLPVESAVGYEYEKESFIPGIWGDASLILTGNPIIERVQIIPYIDTNTAEARITLKNLENTSQEITFSSAIFEKVSGLSASDEINTNFTLAALEEKTVTVTLPVSNMQLWSPDSPFLYSLVSRVKTGETEADTLTTTFGMREFKIVGSDFYLNNDRIFLKGGNIAFHRFLSDSDRADLPWNEAWIKKILIDIPKKHNFNFFRNHLGQMYNKWYDIADEYGMLLQNEWAFWVITGTEEQIRAEFTQWLYDNCNHPSIIIWDAMNEPHDNGEMSRDVIRGIIIPEMKQIDPTRPWEGGINANIDFEPDAWHPVDFAEDHPYIYSMGSVLNKDNFGYSRSIEGIKNSNEPTILNEFVWFWLDKNGGPTSLMGYVLPRWLGENSTPQQQLKYQAQLASDLVELFRRIDVDGIAPFVYLSNEGALTSNWFTGDIADPGVKPIMAALKNAYAPFGVSIELWDRHFLINEARNIDVYIFNDSAVAKSGTLRCRIVDEDDTEVVNIGDYTVNVPASQTITQPIFWTMPSATGTYYLNAQIIPDGEASPVAASKKIIHILEQPDIPSNLLNAKIMVYDPDNEVLDYLVSLDLNAVTYDSAQLSQQDILILGEGALVDTNYGSRVGDITDFIKQGHSLIIVEPSYNITNYQEQEYSILSDLSIAMNKREDKFDGGYDSYCFAEELKLNVKEVTS
ncbi:MAG: beta galactosidase jelly roll domain-containing protein, partial [Candidatus Omnitrophica bacterium]|nr:beta galactosidase jelly roll domain-containing protein [Candidatus Omnitrophota bacterium]